MTATDRLHTPRQLAAVWREQDHSCHRKRRYGKRQAARAARILRDNGEACHAYPCPVCRGNAWHVGHDSDRT